MVPRLLRFWSDWIVSEKVVVDMHGLGWIYALLACISTPIHSRTQIAMRNILIFLSQKRVRITEDDVVDYGLLGGVNVVIYVLVRFFGQDQV